MRDSTPSVRRCRNDELTLARAFYRSVGYEGGIQDSDCVVVAVDHTGDIVGVVRLADEEGEMILRGMFVAAHLQRRGVGHQLLGEVAVQLADRPCWCLPYAHLVDFYGLIGFRGVDPSSAPKHLRERLVEARRKWGDIIVMRREPAR